MGSGDCFVDGDVLGCGVAISPFVVGDGVASGVGGEVCVPERSGEVRLPMERSAVGGDGVVVRLLECGPCGGKDPGAS